MSIKTQTASFVVGDWTVETQYDPETKTHYVTAI